MNYSVTNFACGNKIFIYLVKKFPKWLQIKRYRAFYHFIGTGLKHRESTFILFWRFKIKIAKEV